MVGTASRPAGVSELVIAGMPFWGQKEEEEEKEKSRKQQEFASCGKAT